MKIGVFTRFQSTTIEVPIIHISRPRAKRLVDGGRAVWVNHAHAIRLLYGRTVEQYCIRRPAESQQGQVLESLAIEKYPQIVQGGLTRTETRPNDKPKILSWGHIGEKPTSSPHKQFRVPCRSED
jgi:hypothetical protein